jgi:protein TonB
VEYREKKGTIEVSLSKTQKERLPIQRAKSEGERISRPVHKPKPKKKSKPQLKSQPSHKPEVIPEPKLESTTSGIPSLIENTANKEYTSLSNQDRNNKIEEETFPTYLKNPKPRYPIMARRRKIEGVVLLKVEVLPNGKVGNIKVQRTSGYRILDESALHAIKDWIFIPAKRNGMCIKVWTNIPIRFQLD